MDDPGRPHVHMFPRALLAADTLTVARHLLGARLVRGGGPEARTGRIVEVEAYRGPEDLASHARFGRTKRNAVMFGRPGVAYVYLVYGMYHCLNVVTEPHDTAAALLVRAVAPVSGVAQMRAARLSRAAEHNAGRVARGDEEPERVRRRLGSLPDSRLASGPGLVCVAFSIGGADNGIDLCDPASDLRLEIGADDTPLPASSGPRVGIDYAPEPWQSRPWRFFVPGHASVSVHSNDREVVA